MKIIDGKKIAFEIRENLKAKIENEKLKPGLAIILVGNNPASMIYVRNKLKACQELGITATCYSFQEEDSEEEIIDCIQKLNQDSEVHGILVQSPLPKKFDENKITSFICSSKDVDGFGTYNLGSLASGCEEILAATPYGILKMLEYENVPVEGAHVVIVGRSKIVGRPMSLLLLNRNATVTIAHSKTKKLKEITNMADILIVAIGKPKFITADYIKENAVVIDVGINRGSDGKIVGDVDFEGVKEKVSLITPVPGGVGPMTIAMLLTNVVENAEKIQIKEEI